MKRSGKFYRNNEKSVMKSLGLNPTPNSGSGWIIKEDGENEHVVCQLKSTDKQSIKVNKSDIDTLQYNALVSHKLPVFAIQFLQSNEVFLIVKPEDLTDIVKYLDTGIVRSSSSSSIVDISNHEEMKPTGRKVISSSSKSKKAFTKSMNERFTKKSKSAT